jgi:hypothetical protein
MSSNAKKVTNWLIFNNKNEDGTDFNRENGRAQLKKLKKPSLGSCKKSSRHDKDIELTKSPISGTYIIKDWTNGAKSRSSFFTRSEIELNSVAASFVEKTPQARAKLSRIANKIGPYECKLCKVVYEDAFELAMHNCPRVVHLEYKYILTHPCSYFNSVFSDMKFKKKKDVQSVTSHLIVLLI